MTWVLTFVALSALLGQNPRLAAGFDSPRTFVLVDRSHGNRVPAGTPQATAARSYKDINRFRADLAAGSIPSTVRAVVYDPESWALTPLPQQERPRVYAARFVTLAKAAGLEPIMAPAQNVAHILTSCRPLTNETTADTYVRCGIPAAAGSAYSHSGLMGTYSVPTQHDELAPQEFSRLFSRSLAQARHAHPRLRVLAGLSTGVAQGYATGRQMYAAARALGPAVQGYWLCLNAHDPRAVADVAGFLALEGVR